MEYTTLGRTGLKVSVAGLGAGGASQLGLDRGKTRADAVNVVSLARDLGVNVFDTAHSYMTEDVIGEALEKTSRDEVVLCTKHQVSARNAKVGYPVKDIVAGLDESLRKLRTDYIDVFYIHALTEDHFDYAVKEVVPALLREKDRGKFRFLGMTEAPTIDLQHRAMQRGLTADLFDVVMIGFQLLHQNARQHVFPLTQRANVGTTIMFAVRSIFADPAHLRATFERLAQEQKIPAGFAKKDNPLDFLLHDGGARTLVDAAYRFARHEPGAHVVLTGTGNADHLRANIASITAPPLPAADIDKVKELFGHLADGEGLGSPGRTPIRARSSAASGNAS